MRSLVTPLLMLAACSTFVPAAGVHYSYEVLSQEAIQVFEVTDEIPPGRLIGELALTLPVWANEEYALGLAKKEAARRGADVIVIRQRASFAQAEGWRFLLVRRS